MKNLFLFLTLLFFTNYVSGQSFKPKCADDLVSIDSLFIRLLEASSTLQDPNGGYMYLGEKDTCIVMELPEECKQKYDKTGLSYCVVYCVDRNGNVDYTLVSTIEEFTMPDDPSTKIPGEGYVGDDYSYNFVELYLDQTIRAGEIYNTRLDRDRKISMSHDTLYVEWIGNDQDGIVLYGVPPIKVLCDTCLERTLSRGPLDTLSSVTVLPWNPKDPCIVNCSLTYHDKGRDDKGNKQCIISSDVTTNGTILSTTWTLNGSVVGTDPGCAPAMDILNRPPPKTPLCLEVTVKLPDGTICTSTCCLYICENVLNPFVNGPKIKSIQAIPIVNNKQVSTLINHNTLIEYLSNERNKYENLKYIIYNLNGETILETNDINNINHSLFSKNQFYYIFSISDEKTNKYYSYCKFQSGF